MNTQLWQGRCCSVSYVSRLFLGAGWAVRPRPELCEQAVDWTELVVTSSPVLFVTQLMAAALPVIAVIVLKYPAKKVKVPFTYSSCWHRLHFTTVTENNNFTITLNSIFTAVSICCVTCVYCFIFVCAAMSHLAPLCLCRLTYVCTVSNVYNCCLTYVYDVSPVSVCLTSLCAVYRGCRSWSRRTRVPRGSAHRNRPGQLTPSWGAVAAGPTGWKEPSGSCWLHLLWN